MGVIATTSPQLAYGFSAYHVWFRFRIFVPLECSTLRGVDGTLNPPQPWNPKRVAKGLLHVVGLELRACKRLGPLVVPLFTLKLTSRKKGPLIIKGLLMKSYCFHFPIRNGHNHRIYDDHKDTHYALNSSFHFLFHCP